MTDPEDRLKALNDQGRWLPTPPPAPRAHGRLTRRPALPALAMVGAVAAAVAAAVVLSVIVPAPHPSHDGNGGPVAASTPSPSPTSAAVVPWSGTKADAFPVPASETGLPPRCTVDQLNLSATSGGGAAGTFYVPVTVTNNGETCSIRPRALSGRIRVGSRSRSFGTLTNPLADSSTAAVLAPGGSMTILAGFGCMIEGPADVGIGITLGGATKWVPRVKIPHALFSCRTTFWEARATDVAAPPSGLSAKLSLPAQATAGSLLTYTVTLKNTTNTTITFHRCPAFTEKLTTETASTTATYTLNCLVHPRLAPGESVAYAMRIHVPAKASGVAKFLWTLHTGTFAGDIMGITAKQVSGDNGPHS